MIDRDPEETGKNSLKHSKTPDCVTKCGELVESIRNWTLTKPRHGTSGNSFKIPETLSKFSKKKKTYHTWLTLSTK